MNPLKLNSWFWLFGGILILCFCNIQSIKAQPLAQQESFAEIKWSNDFFNQTDRYFSNGFDLAVYHQFMKKSPTRFVLLPSPKANEVYHSLTLTHHLFTPDHLFSEEIQSWERPFASYALLGHKKTALYSRRKIRLESEFQVGIMGKYSGGESVQNGIHKILPASRSAIGWSNQLGSDLALNYHVRGEKGIVSSRYFALVPHGDIRAGIPYTDASAGLYFQIGKFPDYFEKMTLFSDQGINYYAFADFSGRYVLYNATLQGGLINDSPHTLLQVNPFVSEFKFGFAVGFRSVSLEYTQHYISQEYTKGMQHKWGTFTIRVKF